MISNALKRLLPHTHYRLILWWLPLVLLAQLLIFFPARAIIAFLPTQNIAPLKHTSGFWWRGATMMALDSTHDLLLHWHYCPFKTGHYDDVCVSASWGGPDGKNSKIQTTLPLLHLSDNRIALQQLSLRVYSEDFKVLYQRLAEKPLPRNLESGFLTLEAETIIIEHLSVAHWKGNGALSRVKIKGFPLAINAPFELIMDSEQKPTFRSIQQEDSWLDLNVNVRFVRERTLAFNLHPSLRKPYLKSPLLDNLLGLQLNLEWSY